MFRQIPDNVVYNSNKTRHYIMFGIEDLNLITDYDNIMPQTKHFCENWGVSFDYVLDKLREKRLLHKMFCFAYDYYEQSEASRYKYAQLVDEDHFYTTKQELVRGTYHTVVKTRYNAYIIETNCTGLFFKEIIPDIIKDHYNWLYVEVFTNRFSSELPDIDVKHLVSSYQSNIEFGKLTLEDIAFICNNPQTWRDYKVNKFMFTCYDDMLCTEIEVCNVGDYEYRHSIIIPIEAILKRDWSIVENYNVHSIRDTRPGYLKWYDGEQKNSPYWDNEKVKEIQKLFEK